jgi:3-hydroxyacyl-CoA dehydrogenase
MTYQIRKAAVIGSGTMGGGIAALLAGVGIQTTLLDIAAMDTQPGDPPAKRNAVVNEGVKRLQTLRPPQVYAPADLDLLRTGNIDDNLDWAADADWVIEVVVERLDVKRSLMAKLAEVISPTTIVTTNTSGIPIRAIAEGMPDDIRRRFLGTHFFNPPRYLQLLEVIPHEGTDPAVVDALVTFGRQRLGKGVVLCKDKPNFIGNRFMTMTGMQIINYALDYGFSVDEVDALTGPLIGRPKTATFRLNDLVGIDVAVGVARNLYPAIPDDPARTVLEHAGTTALFDKIILNGWLGNKSGQGFYKQMKGAGGEKEFWTLNLNTFEYEAPTKPRFDSVGKHRKVEATGERIRLLINEEDRAGQLLFHHHAFYLAYASQRVPEITDSIVNVDNAQKWGFSHELGPFEIWDAMGVADSVPRFEAAGYEVAGWVKDMLASGHTTFYQRNANGVVTGYYSPQDGAYVPMQRDAKAYTAAALKAGGKTVAGNSSASVIDMGDGVALLDIHSPAQAIDDGLLEMGYKAAEIAEREFAGLVVGTDAERFCVGANLVMIAMAVQAGQLEQLDGIIRTLQDLTQRWRYATVPVVVAPANLALGGGTEILMGGARAVAHMELYAGLVEFGVGVIPAGGGCKELVRRVLNPVMQSHPNADPIPHLQKVFEQIATAKVSGSAKEAREMGILAPTDRIVMNRAHLLGEAKREALHMADDYVPQRAGKVYAAGRDVYAALQVGIMGFREQGIASEHDALLAKRLAYVLTGGGVAEPGWVDEQVLLNLEREAFMEVVQTQKSLERMAHMVQFNKALRN